MLKLFAEAMLIATRMGGLPEGTGHSHRRSPREFQDIEGLNTADRLRFQGR